MTSMTTMTIGRTSILVKFIARTMLAVVAVVAVVTVTVVTGVTVITVTSVVFKLVFPWLATAARRRRKGPLVAIHFEFHCILL